MKIHLYSPETKTKTACGNKVGYRAMLPHMVNCKSCQKTKLHSYLQDVIVFYLSKRK